MSDEDYNKRENTYRCLCREPVDAYNPCLTGLRKAPSVCCKVVAKMALIGSSGAQRPCGVQVVQEVPGAMCLHTMWQGREVHVLWPRLALRQQAQHIPHPAH